MSVSKPEPIDEIKVVFETYVFGFVKADIGREIYLAKGAESDKTAGRDFIGGGNVLAALGLTCYSEYLGSFITGKRIAPADNWEAFVSTMGKCYEELIRSEGRRLWSDYRNGLAHEYAIHGNAVIYMVKNDESCGLGKAEDGSYWFVVERYFDDFMTAAEKLYAQLLEEPKLPR